MENNNNPKSLYQKYLDGNITAEELEHLFRYFGTANEKDLAELIRSELAKTDHEPVTLSEQQELELIHVQLTARLFGEEHEEKSKTIKLWPRIAAAAAILVFISIGIYKYEHKPEKPKSEFANDVAPGTTKSFLTLANGKKVVIGNNSGLIAKQGAVTIQRNTGGQITYSNSQTQVIDAPYNTLTNPPGSKVVSLLLPDGSKVKLDAGSSITYQTAFTGKTRNISSTGKVYFEVAYNTKQPFLVTTNGQVTKDLGTHFIIESFDDEPAIKTTLIEGRVSVTKGQHSVLLKPGQQTVGLNIQPADLDQETAWINGDFDFNNQDLHSIMRELARVYNIDVAYKGDVGNIVPNSMISRSHNISAILQMIETTNNIHFEINGRRVMVIAGHR